MRTSILILAACAAVLALSCSASRAVMMLPDPGPQAPQPSAAETETSRAAQQAEAPVIEGGETPADTDNAPAEDIRTSDEEQQTSSFAEALAVRDEQEPAEMPQPVSKEPETKTRGRWMVMLGAAGLMGLTLGRFAMNSLSRTSVREAEQAVEAEDIDDGSRSLGGDHREYIIE